jgi:hypothetical protein
VLGMNKNDALGALEDVVIVKSIAAGAQARVEAKTFEQQDELLRRGAQKIAELWTTIEKQQAQLAAAIARAERAEAELESLREINADHVAVANAAALTLKQAVGELKAKTDEPELKEDQYLRKVRTKNYHQQINKFMSEGLLKSDPRTTDAVKWRTWYVEGLDPEHGL